MRALVYNLFLALFLATAISTAFMVPVVIPFLGIVALQVLNAFFGKQLERGILADSVDVYNLSAYAGKNAKTLIATMMNGLDFIKDVMVIPNVKTKQQIGKLDVGAGARPYSDSEEFQDGDLQYTDRWLEVEEGKREVKISPKKYRTTFMSEMMTPGSNSQKTEIPFEQWTWREVFKALWAEINNQTAWNGFDKADAVAFDAGDTYDAGDYVTFTPSGTTVKHWYKCLATTTAGQSPDTTAAKWQKSTAEAVFKGYGTRIIEELAASALTAEAIGAISATAGVARGAFLELYRSMPVAYQQNGGVIINCSYTDWNFLQDDIENVSKYTRHDATVGPGQQPTWMFLPGSNNQCIVKPATWITGRRMIAGPAKNVGGNWKNAALLFGTDLLSDMNTINILQAELWQLKAGISFLGGTQIANLEEIRVNDQV